MDAAPPTGRPFDPWAIDGKFAAPDEHVQLLVIGAGPAGLAAAIAAAGLGLSVVLIDENPVPAALMGLDVPLFYGQRMNPAVQEQARMVERLVAATPAIEAAFDAGVDVRMGVIAWGVFTPGPALNGLPGRAAGLSDGSKSWICGFDALILATGARDLVLGFAGVDLPGVMGARALQSLLHRYDAFDGKRLVILGSGDMAAEAALSALDRGLEVDCLVEVLPEPQAAPHLLAELGARNVAIRTDTTIVRADSDATGVTGAIVTRKGEDAPERLACDTICLAIGAVPSIELAGVAGCRLGFRGDLGGHVPLLGADGASSVAGIFCVGDCAGLAAEAMCEAQGRAAARAVAAWLGTPAMPAAGEPVTPSGADSSAYRMAWMRALLAAGGMQAPVCLCEEVSRAELLGIAPPRYLGCASEKMAARDSKSLLRDGPLNPDQIKRLTRAGMGPCQGRRCREQIALLLALASDTAPAAIPLASYRAPVRPLPLSLLADMAETPDMQAGWDVWFGIPTQWIPYAQIGTEAETALLAAGGGGNMHA
jgi:thioredoxin reductase